VVKFISSAGWDGQDMLCVWMIMIQLKRYLCPNPGEVDQEEDLSEDGRPGGRRCSNSWM
jgi:hypothetical protein